MNVKTFLAALTVSLLLAGSARSDTFGTGADSFEIEFVTIGRPGNPADSVGNLQPEPAQPGSVDYEFRIGKFEISERMIDVANTLGSLNLSRSTRGPNKPATNLTWFEAARFVNWLNTSTNNQPAYKFAERIEVDGRGRSETFFDFELWEPEDPGYDPENLFRNSRAKYFMPSVDEWYKAAFFDPESGQYFDYPTGSDDPPLQVASGQLPGTAVYGQPVGPADIFLAGGASPFGTVGQGGNVLEVLETELDLVNDSVSDPRFGRGASWEGVTSGLSVANAVSVSPSQGFPSNGFRVASIIPEPTSIAMIVSSFIMVCICLRSIHRSHKPAEIAPRRCPLEQRSTQST